MTTSTEYASRFKQMLSTICEDADGDNETFAFVNNGNIIFNGNDVKTQKLVTH